VREDAREEWKEIRLKGAPRLLVGWREGRRLSAYRVRLYEDVFGDLAKLCQPAVSQIQNYVERNFENFAGLDDSEYFWYAHAALPSREGPITGHAASITVSHEIFVGAVEENTSSPNDDTADLVRLVKSVDGLQEATREDLDEGGYSFYAICWPHRRSMIGFVSRMNPMATLKPGFRYFQFGDAMTTAVRPDFSLREGADLVIGNEGTAILSPFSFEILLGDVGVRFDRVSDDVAAVRTALADTINLTSFAEEALLFEASRTRSYARRLRLLPDRLSKIGLDAETLRGSLIVHEVDPSLLFDENGNFSFDHRNVGMFFDVIEGRYFEDDLGGERRRADRYSTR
jgi:hypothetical protein